MQTMTSGKEAAVSCGLSASGAAGGQAGSVEVFDGELASDTITGDGETAAEAGAELDQKRIIVMLLHGQVDGFAATQGFVCLYGFHHGISLYKLSVCSLYWQMSGQWARSARWRTSAQEYPARFRGVCTFKEGAKDHADA